MAQQNQTDVKPAGPLARKMFIFVAAASFLLVAAIFLQPSAKPADSGDIKILCTFLPVYVFTANVVGNTPGVEVELLVSADAGCPHHYALRAVDLKRIARADVIVANGLGIDKFIEESIRRNSRAKLITISDNCEVITRKAVHEDHPEGHETGEINPHVWASPLEASRQVRTLAQKLAEVDPQHAENYAANSAAFIARLEALHQDMLKAAEHFTNRKVVTFHDAFDYLARDLNLDVVATLTVEPDHAPSARQMAKLIDTIKATQAAAVFYEPAYSDRAARTVARDAGVPTYPLNPFNTIDRKPTVRSYEEVMRRNLEILQQALGSGS